MEFTLLTRLRRDEHGLTVVEGMIAALLLTLGALGVMQVFDASTRNNFRAEQSQAVNNRLQAELERIRQLPYDQIALTAYPSESADQNDPRWRVADTAFAIARDGDPGSAKELVVNGAAIPGQGSEQVSGGVVDPGPEEFTAGDISGEIHRFITWTTDPECPGECGEAVMKRIVVAAKLTEAPVSFERAFQEVQTDVVDPDLAPDQNPAPPGDPEDGNVVELWLTDTSCDHQTRQIPAVPHDAHNTRGRCEDAEQTGDATPGAPDLLYPEAPPEPDPLADPPYPLLAAHDFSADVSGSEDGIGLTMPWPDSDSCTLRPAIGAITARALRDGTQSPLAAEPGPRDGLLDLPSPEPNQHLRVHRWLTPPLTGTGGVLTGEGALDLWTRTVNGAIHPGEICITLFVRRPLDAPWDDGEDSGVASLEVDLPYANVGPLTNFEGFVCDQGLSATYFRCSTAAWPQEWTRVSVPLEFTDFDATGQPVAAGLPPGSQIGLAVAVKRGGTEPGEGLELMYDHVDFESRLQLETEAPLSLG